MLLYAEARAEDIGITAPFLIGIDIFSKSEKLYLWHSSRKNCTLIAANTNPAQLDMALGC